MILRLLKMDRYGESGQQPDLITSPFNLNDEEDRIRTVFRLASDDPLPSVNSETLEIYRDYLTEQLSFPFEAVWETYTGPFSTTREYVSVLSFGDPDEQFRPDDLYGLICEIRTPDWQGDAPLDELEAKQKGRNQQLLADYCSWFWNNR